MLVRPLPGLGQSLTYDISITLGYITVAFLPAGFVIYIIGAILFFIGVGNMAKLLKNKKYSLITDFSENNIQLGVKIQF